MLTQCQLIKQLNLNKSRSSLGLTLALAELPPSTLQSRATGYLALCAVSIKQPNSWHLQRNLASRSNSSRWMSQMTHLCAKVSLIFFARHHASTFSSITQVSAATESPKKQLLSNILIRSTSMSLALYVAHNKCSRKCVRP